MVGSSVEVVWSRAALRDLDRFAEFLLEANPLLAAEIADAIIREADMLGDMPMIGRPMADGSFRQVLFRVRNAMYVLHYRIARRRIVILRVFHGREQRE